MSINTTTPSGYEYDEEYIISLINSYNEDELKKIFVEMIKNDTGLLGAMSKVKHNSYNIF